MNPLSASQRDQSPPASLGRRVWGCLMVPVVLGILIFAGWSFTGGMDALLVAPWAYPLFGRPALAGHWAGTFTTPSGIRFALYLELERSLDAGGAPESDEQRGVELIGGRANWCDDRGRRVENTPVHGSVPSFSGYTGSADSVALQLDAGSPPPAGLLPTVFQGQWRVDTLTLKLQFSFWTGSAFQSSSSNPDQTRPMTIILKKAEVDTFRAACGRFANG